MHVDKAVIPNPFLIKVVNTLTGNILSHPTQYPLPYLYASSFG